MSTPKSIPTEAVAYLRKSTLRQEDSIESQRKQLTAWAATNRVTITREYIDEGISGDDLEGRPAFQELMADVRAGRVRQIAVDEFSRLSRADPITTIADIIRPLRTARVKVFTAKDGPVMWDGIGNLILLTVHSDQTNKEARDLAYRVLRAARLGVSRGERRGGRPYGYHLDQSGGKKMGKAPGKLVVYEPEAAVVRLMFARAIAGDSTHAIADLLNRSGHPSPRGGRWSVGTVKQLLRNPVYAGHFHWGRDPQGKHWRLHNSEQVETGKLPDQSQEHDTWEVRRDAHPALIDQATFDAAQDALDGRSAFRGKSIAKGGYTLSGMLTCAHCGRTLFGRVDRRGKVRYECQPTDNNGAVVCRYYGVRESRVLEVIARSLRVSFTDPETLAAVKAEVEAQAAALRAPAALEALEKAVALRREDEARAARVLSLIPDDLIENVACELRRLKEERKRAEAELQAAREATAVIDLTEAINAAGKALRVLEVALAEADQQTVRDVLRPLIDHVELRWEARAAKNGSKKPRYNLCGGRIVLSTVADTSKTRTERHRRRLALPLVVA